MIFFILFISFLIKGGARIFLSHPENYWESGYRSFLDPMLAVLARIGLASLLKKKPEPTTI